MKMVMRWLLVGLLAFAVTGVAACGGDDEGSAGGEEPAAGGQQEQSGDQTVAVGLAMPCPINDQSWCQQGYEAAKALEDQGMITLKYTDSAPQDATGAEQVITQFATGGADLVIAHSTWQDPTLSAAKKVPDANFAFAGGGETADNVATYLEPIYQAAYLAGILAGDVTETNVIGGMAGEDVPLCRAELDAFAAGAKRVNDQVKMKNSFVGDWNDIAKSKEAALALADQKVDVIIACGGAQAAGMAEAIKDRDISGVGYVADQSSLAPKNMLGSVVYNLEPYFKAMVEDVKNDSFSPGKEYDLGLAEGGVQFVLNDGYSAGKVSQEATDLMEKVQTQVENGEFEVPGAP